MHQDQDSGASCVVPFRIHLLPHVCLFGTFFLSLSYNNGYSTEFHFAVDDYTPAVEEKPFKAEGFVPGYQGFVRGSQFVHGNTFGKTTRELQSVPTSVPLQP